jgi:hypothetical protein
LETDLNFALVSEVTGLVNWKTGAEYVANDAVVYKKWLLNVEDV